MAKVKVKFNYLTRQFEFNFMAAIVYQVLALYKKIENWSNLPKRLLLGIGIPFIVLKEIVKHIWSSLLFIYIGMLPVFLLRMALLYSTWLLLGLVILIIGVILFLAILLSYAGRKEKRRGGYYQ